ncbi:MAG: hypothetical protein JEZ06_08170 [Anaerolineaceae bacterium]|nr:hypothetical protein [Anaerolineaceae bacterium]
MNGKRILIFVLLLIVLAGCSSPTGEDATRTIEAAVNQTVAAQKTLMSITQSVTPLADLPTVASEPDEPESTATHFPTRTPTVTFTSTEEPTATLTATRTEIPVSPTISRTPPIPSKTPLPYDCTIKEMPLNWAVYKPREDIDGHWVLVNKGSEAWKPEATFLKYLYGDHIEKFQDTSYDLSKIIHPTGEYEYVLDLAVPSEPGNYSMTWGLILDDGDEIICEFSIRIVVRE